MQNLCISHYHAHEKRRQSDYNDNQNVEITSAGIRKILNKYTPERAIAEYVWNGMDLMQKQPL